MTSTDIRRRNNVAPPATGHCPQLSTPGVTADALPDFLDRTHT